MEVAATQEIEGLSVWSSPALEKAGFTGYVPSSTYASPFKAAQGERNLVCLAWNLKRLHALVGRWLMYRTLTAEGNPPDCRAPAVTCSRLFAFLG